MIDVKKKNEFRVTLSVLDAKYSTAKNGLQGENGPENVVLQMPTSKSDSFDQLKHELALTIQLARIPNNK